jgi:hypothetical protein
MSEQACLSADWRTVGFEDGALGRAETSIARYRQQCGEYGVAPDLASYRAGYADGVRIYCRATNGFSVDHSGVAYQGVCPADLEPQFVAEYNAAAGSMSSSARSPRASCSTIARRSRPRSDGQRRYFLTVCE